jgi:hypothetical protein
LGSQIRPSAAARRATGDGHPSSRCHHAGTGARVLLGGWAVVCLGLATLQDSGEEPWMLLALVAGAAMTLPLRAPPRGPAAVRTPGGR